MGEEDAAEEPTAEAAAERFDFDDFGPAAFEEMSPEEWSAAFDAEAWVTGEALLDRVEVELRHRVHDREVFAVVERIRSDGEPCVLAYSDEGYALVRPDGTVEGFGTVLRDVKPTVALCSMPEYEPASGLDDPVGLPDPAAVETARTDLGNVVIQVVALAFGIGGLVLLGAWILFDATLAAAVVGVGFLVGAAILAFLVANARLSSRYRAEDYRGRLRSVGLGSGERPAFVPEDEGAEGRGEPDDGSA
ncbi:MAG: hypothetical protein ACLFMX_03165 [Halobacteriales archaeon]